MCTVYLWIGFAVNLARFLVPHFLPSNVAAHGKKNFASCLHLHPLILQCLKMHPVSAEVQTWKGRDWNMHRGPHWVQPWPVSGAVGTVLAGWSRPDHSCPFRTWPSIWPGKASHRVCHPFGRKYVAKIFVMEQVTAGHCLPRCCCVIAAKM